VRQSCSLRALWAVAPGGGAQPASTERAGARRGGRQAAARRAERAVRARTLPHSARPAPEARPTDAGYGSGRAGGGGRASRVGRRAVRGRVRGRGAHGRGAGRRRPAARDLCVALHRAAPGPGEPLPPTPQCAPGAWRRCGSAACKATFYALLICLRAAPACAAPGPGSPALLASLPRAGCRLRSKHSSRAFRARAMLGPA